MTKSPHPSSVDKGELLPVTQADRDAAAAYVRDRFDDDLLANEILRGTCDRTSMTVQAFARHRQAHPLPGDVGRAEFLTLLDLVEDGTTWNSSPAQCVDRIRQIVRSTRRDIANMSAASPRANRAVANDAFLAGYEAGENGDGLDDALDRYLAALTPSALSANWVAEGIPDNAIEAGIEAWRAADVGMEAREHSANPEDMTDWDEGMIVAAIFKAVSRAMCNPSALSGDAGEIERLREAVKLTIADASYHLQKFRPHCLEALRAALPTEPTP